MAFSVRRERPADEPAVRRVVADAFAGRDAGRDPGRDAGAPPEAGLLDSLRGDPAWIEAAWVGELDGAVVAQVTVVAVRVGGEPAPALGIVSVSPAHQRQGYGSRLIWAAIRTWIERGDPLVVVFGSPRYYGRFGFVPGPVVGVQSPRYPAPFLQALALRTGHPRGTVEYPPPYADLAD